MLPLYVLNNVIGLIKTLKTLKTLSEASDHGPRSVDRPPAAWVMYLQSLCPYTSINNMQHGRMAPHSSIDIRTGYFMLYILSCLMY